MPRTIYDKKCPKCKKKFETLKSKQICCSKSCSQKGNKKAAGHTHSYSPTEEAKKKQSETRKRRIAEGKIKLHKFKVKKGSEHPCWIGDKIGYTVHLWISNNFGKPDHCDLCGRTERPKLNGKGKTFKGNKNYFEWSSRTHKYTRNLQEWWQLCRKCHFHYDKEMFGSNFGKPV